MAFKNRRQSINQKAIKLVVLNPEISEFLAAIFVMSQTFYPDALPAKTAKLLTTIQLQNPEFLADFYLSGGTALSLLLGHRESEDLDWFNLNNFDPVKLQPKLEALGSLTQVELEENTLNAYLDGVKVQFLGYPYPLLEPVTIWEKIKISSLTDIACTKLQTIGMRGSKKDFIDLYFLLKQFKLEELFGKLKQKYSGADYSLPHILKSLVYFANADGQPMPRMHQEVSWEAIKKEIVKKIKAIKF